MVRAIIQYESEPDAERYRRHVDEFAAKVECSAFRHGKVFGSPFGEPTFRYYAEFEWDDMDAFKAAASQPAFAESGKDASDMGIPFTVNFVTCRVSEPTHPRPRDPADFGFETIVYTKEPPRATIRLNRPDVLNAFDFLMLREIARAAEDASWDDDVHAVVVTGTGRAFCVGADLRSWDEDYLGNPKDYWKWFGAFKDAHDRLREIGKPTIARINGIAVGGGNELQMACDLAVIVDSAFIRHVGLQHGSVPAGGATQWLQLMVGDRRAREIVFLCDEIPGGAGGRVGAREPVCARGGARCRRRRVGREARGAAPADDALRQAPAQRLARSRVAPDGRPRARLALALDARRRGAGRGAGVPGSRGKEE